MEIRLHTVGEISGGIYSGWYIFIQSYQTHDAFLLHTANHPSFGKEALSQVQSYDTWIQNTESLESQLEYWAVETIHWRDDLPAKLPSFAT
jgi:hypothetical protein